MKRGGGYSAHVNGNFMSVQDLDTVCDNLKELFDRQASENARLKQNLQEITDEAWKDAELTTMREQLEAARADLRRGFEITERQTQRIQEWKDKHYAEQHGATTLDAKLKMGGAAGGSFSYEFLPTGIGTFGTCVCGHCRAKAFHEAQGNEKLYQKLLKDYDAEFIFQEAW